jgi:hypothetical protein
MWMEAYRAPGKGVPRSHHRSFDSTHPNLVAAFTQNASMERRMSSSAQHHAINYIEFTTTDIAATKAFYEKAFGWNFQDYGPDYIAFDKDHAGIDGGFRKGEPQQAPSDTAPLIVLYSQDLKARRTPSSPSAVPSPSPPSIFQEASASTSPTARATSSPSGPNRHGQQTNAPAALGPGALHAQFLNPSFPCSLVLC